MEKKDRVNYEDDLVGVENGRDQSLQSFCLFGAVQIETPTLNYLEKVIYF